MLFALFGTLAVLLFASLVPPFLNPDEAEHFLRADQVSNGGLLASFGPAATARIDAGIWAAVRPFRGVGADHQAHVERGMYAPVGWGARQVDGAANTAVYPPVFYLPAACAIRLGKLSGLAVLPTLRLSRVFQGLASVAVGAAAVALAGTASLWLFAVLALPMSLSQMAGCGQDGLLIASTALAVSLALLPGHAGRRGGLRFGLLCLLLVLVGSARPPLAAFALLALLADQVAWRWRVAGAVAVVAAVGAWSWLSVTVSGVDPGHFNGSDAAAQAAGLLAAPWRVLGLAARTCRLNAFNYGEQFLGRLGWLDVALPFGFRLCAGALLAVAALSSWRAGSGARGGRTMLLAALAIAGAVVAMFATQYLTWTRVGGASVEGMQGRYFLPPALLLGLVLARPALSGSRLAAYAAWPVAVFPVATIVVCVRSIVLRYYL